MSKTQSGLYFARISYVDTFKGQRHDRKQIGSYASGIKLFKFNDLLHLYSKTPILAVSLNRLPK